MENLKRLTAGRRLSLDVNISDMERQISVMVGAALMLFGLARAPKRLP